VNIIKALEQRKRSIRGKISGCMLMTKKVQIIEVRCEGRLFLPAFLQRMIRGHFCRELFSFLEVAWEGAHFNFWSWAFS